MPANDPAQYMRDWRERNKERVAEYRKTDDSRARQKKWRARGKATMLAAKSRGCDRCGCKPANLADLIFHHRDPVEKSFDVARWAHVRGGYAGLVSEMKKCDVLCKPCHLKADAEVRARPVALKAVVGYARVSTEEQGSSGLGLEAQRAAITKECEHRGWELLEIHEDVASGKNAERPGLALALDEIALGPATALVVAKLDRLSRSLVDFAQVMETARRGSWDLVALDVAIDTTTPNGEMIAGIMAVLAQWERQIIGQRTREALAAKRANGDTLGRPVSANSEHTACISRLHESGLSVQAIVEKLEADGVPAPNGGSRWHHSTVRRILNRGSLR